MGFYRKTHFHVIVYCVYFHLCTGILYYNAHTNIGTVTGKIESLVYNGTKLQYVMYLGIPYASNPTDWIRFKPLSLRAPFKRPYNATYFRSPCLQTGFVAAKHNPNEDCLFLNVYAPLESTINPKRKFPVLIYIHGGSFTSGASTHVSPEILSTTGSMIIVSINYRLGIFGFLNSGNSHAKGNYGLWDQQLAIRWVRYNIGEFGGDVERITLMGHEAGAASAILQAFYPGNRGLFQRVIAMSGSCFSPWALHGTNMREVAEALDCYDENDIYRFSDQPYIECIRNKSASEIIKIQHKIRHLGPTVDGEFLIDHPLKIINSNGNITFEDSLSFFRSLDIVTGITSADGSDVMKKLFANEFGQSNFNAISLKSDEFEQILIPDILQPVIDNHELLINKTMDTFTRNNVKYSVMFQYTNWSDPDNNRSMKNNLLRLSTDANFVVPTVQLADAHSYINYNKSIYVYQFDHRPSFKPPVASWVKGAEHRSELLFSFGFPGPMMAAVNLARMNISLREYNLSTTMMTWLTNFVKSGNPNMPVPLTMNKTKLSWPKYRNDRQYIRFDTNMTTNTSIWARFGEPGTSFWTTLVPVLLESSRPNSGDKRSDVTLSFTVFHFSPDNVENVIVALMITICGLFVVIIMFIVCACRYIN